MKIEIEKVVPTTLFCRGVDKYLLTHLRVIAEENGMTLANLLNKIFKEFVKDNK